MDAKRLVKSQEIIHLPEDTLDFQREVEATLFLIEIYKATTDEEMTLQ